MVPGVNDRNGIQACVLWLVSFCSLQSSHRIVWCRLKVNELLVPSDESVDASLIATMTALPLFGSSHARIITLCLLNRLCAPTTKKESGFSCSEFRLSYIATMTALSLFGRGHMRLITLCPISRRCATITKVWVLWKSRFYVLWKSQSVGSFCSDETDGGYHALRLWLHCRCQEAVIRV